MTKSLTIIIVTFNSSKVIEQCLGHLNADKYDVLVIDNISSDNTCKIVENSFPKVEIIRNDRNLGYGRANNIGLRRAKTEFALILNPDAIIFEDSIERVLDFMKNNKEVAIAGTNLLANYPVSKEDLEKISLKIKNIDRSGIFNGHIRSGVVGAVMFLKIEVFKNIGFFDENIFMYCEDGEICIRTTKSGYETILVNDSYAFHREGNSSGSKLRNVYRRYWHLCWSRAYFNSNNNITIYSTIRRTFIRFFNTIISLLTFNGRKTVSNFASFAGYFSFLIGLKAFRKDGTPRG